MLKFQDIFLKKIELFLLLLSEAGKYRIGGGGGVVVKFLFKSWNEIGLNILKITESLVLPYSG